MSDIEIVEQIGSHRLVRDGNGRFAVIEARDGKVFSTAPGDGEAAADTPRNMAAAAARSGWSGEREARDAFDAVVRTGERYARRIW